MKKPTNSFIVGAVALVFGILGYQTALLVHYAATARIVANRDFPDTVYIYRETGPATQSGGPGRSNAGWSQRSERHNSAHSGYAGAIRRSAPASKVESFRFNPNTVTVEDLMRLGLSAKGAASIESYRLKGGRFRRKEDFAKSYAVSDSLYRRLEEFIDIPKVDINLADSAAFDALPGIGGYFASRMVSYRRRLHGYSYPEQLMDIRNFDSSKFEAIRDLICLSPPEPLQLWSLPSDSLSSHPYIGRAARGVVFFREHNPRSKWMVKELEKAGVLTPSDAARLSRCRIE